MKAINTTTNLVHSIDANLINTTTIEPSIREQLTTILYSEARKYLEPTKLEETIEEQHPEAYVADLTDEQVEEQLTKYQMAGE